MPVIKIPLLSFATLYGFSGVSESYVITPLKGHHPVLCTCFVSSQNASRHIPWCSREAPPRDRCGNLHDLKFGTPPENLRRSL